MKSAQAAESRARQALESYKAAQTSVQHLAEVVDPTSYGRSAGGYMHFYELEESILVEKTYSLLVIRAENPNIDFIGIVLSQIDFCYL